MSYPRYLLLIRLIKGLTPRGEVLLRALSARQTPHPPNGLSSSDYSYPTAKVAPITGGYVIYGVG